MITLFTILIPKFSLMFGISLIFVSIIIPAIHLLKKFGLLKNTFSVSFLHNHLHTISILVIFFFVALFIIYDVDSNIHYCAVDTDNTDSSSDKGSV